jgi:hypothetical protein
MKPLQSSAPITLGAHPHEIDEKDLHLLERAAEKLVRFGKQVGVTTEEMISLLDSGISIRDLLAFLASKTSGAA